MANLTSVGITNGVPTSGTGTVSTIDNLANIPITVANASIPVTNVGTTPILARIYDGTNGASIRGSNSPSNLGDPALVVTLSGNSPVSGQVTTSAPTYGSGSAGALSLDTSGNLRVNVVSGGTSGAVTQGSTTSGQSGQLVQGAVTTGSPTYTTAQTSPLSLDTSGSLRVNVVSGGAGGGIVTQATASNLNTRTQLYDGTNLGTIKAASTAPLATDTALVVSISPNSINPNGQTTASASAPVVLASDKGLLGVGHTAAPTPVTDGTTIPFITDKVGKQVCVGSIRDLKGEAAITLTASTSETTLVAAVASTFIDVYGLIITNTSATGTEVVIRDATGGGTARSFYVPAGDTRGFMLPEGAAMKQATVNTNWTAQCTTSVSSIKIDALYVKNI